MCIDTNELVLGFAAKMYTIIEGESESVCVHLISPNGDIGNASISLDVVVDNENLNVPPGHVAS